MSKQEFLDELEDSLAGEVSEQIIRESLQYYNHYIDEEMDSGKSEEDIMNALGRGSFIARSIIEANRPHAKNEYNETTQNKFQEKKYKKFDLGEWYAKMIVIVIFIILLAFFVILIGGALAILGAAIALLFKLAVPILLILGILYLIIYFFGGK